MGKRKIIHVSQSEGTCDICGRDIENKVFNLRAGQTVINSRSFCYDCSIGVAMYLLRAWGHNIPFLLRNIAEGLALAQTGKEYATALRCLAEELDKNVND